MQETNIHLPISSHFLLLGRPIVNSISILNLILKTPSRWKAGSLSRCIFLLSSWNFSPKAANLKFGILLHPYLLTRAHHGS